MYPPYLSYALSTIYLCSSLAVTSNTSFIINYCGSAMLILLVVTMIVHAYKITEQLDTGYNITQAM